MKNLVTRVALECSLSFSSGVVNVKKDAARPPALVLHQGGAPEGEL